MESSQEEYWLLGAGWRSLRNEVVAAFDITPLITGLSKGVDHFRVAVREAVASLQLKLSSHAESGSDAYKLKLSLLSDSQSLIDSLIKDYPSLVSPPQPDMSAEQIVHTTFKQFLENSRRDMLPGSQHRRKVWERLKSCAEKCERDWFSEQAHVSWLDTQFLTRLLDLIRLYYPEDKNLPRTLVGLEAYIYEYGNVHLSLNDAELDQLMDEHWCAASGVSHQEALEECLSRLAAGYPELLEAISVKFGLGRVHYYQVQHYLQDKGLSRRQYQSRVSQGLGSVRECITEKVRWDWESA